eukprot:CAMPEP_0113672554 /NCGR_PEP_ID=MMETSP0038_2-20120614/6336_1 /TAXON_ID=2898 /ORGANISM="Cryptomonas paramecium" /LENGTH=272 /DNA_ID=CAMNT_0000588853 /DNA_START=180 /DNA_END=995 /DNA_ORIENTATION=+ /assembly_acc=CAM_ASM_000170
MPEISICSFSFKTGEPKAHLVLDARFLPDPRCVDSCNSQLCGKDAAIEQYICSNFQIQPFFSALSDKVLNLIDDLSLKGERKIVLAFGCTAGKHRSVFVAEMLYSWLRERRSNVRISHRDIELDRSSPTSSMEHGFAHDVGVSSHVPFFGQVEHCTYSVDKQCIVPCEMQETRRCNVTQCAPIMLSAGLKKVQALKERRALNRGVDCRKLETEGLLMKKHCSHPSNLFDRGALNGDLHRDMSMPDLHCMWSNSDDVICPSLGPLGETMDMEW